MIIAFIRAAKLQTVDADTMDVIASVDLDPNTDSRDLKFSPDGSVIAFILNDETLLVWDANTLEFIMEIPNSVHYEFNPRSDEVVIGGYEELRVQTLSGEVRKTVPVDDVHGLEYSPDGQRIMVSQTYRIVLYDSELNTIARTVVGNVIDRSVYTHSGDYIVVYAMIGHAYVFVLNANDLTVHEIVPVTGSMARGAYPMDNTYSVYRNGGYRIIDVDSREQVQTSDVLGDQTIDAFSDDGRYALGVTEDVTVLTNVFTGERRTVLNTPYTTAAMRTDSVVLL